MQTLKLDNGLQILIQEDHAIPNVAMYLFYRVGSRNERPGTTGISHFFEHMMFNGTKKWGPKQFDITMEAAGGANNAYTSPDVTVYMDSFPNTALELIIRMEADRMTNLNFDPGMVESERGVVASERRLRAENDNTGLLAEQLVATAFTAHPYQWPVVGWASDIESWTIDDLKQHYRLGYAPNNCLIVIVGEVKAAEVRALAKTHFEPIPRQNPPEPVRTREPEQRGERRLAVRKPAELPMQMFGYHVRESRHADDAALRILVALLTEGRSSRLYKRLVDVDQIALSVSPFVNPSLDPGLLVFLIQPRSGIDPQRTEAALFEEIEKVQSSEVPGDELIKVKNQVVAAHYRGLKTIAGRANLLGTYEVFYGAYSRLFTFERDVDKVTAEDLQRVAREYLTERNRTVATLIPEAPSSTERAQ